MELRNPEPVYNINNPEYMSDIYSKTDRSNLSKNTIKRREFTRKIGETSPLAYWVKEPIENNYTKIIRPLSRSK